MNTHMLLKKERPEIVHCRRRRGQGRDGTYAEGGRARLQGGGVYLRGLDRTGACGCPPLGAPQSRRSYRGVGAVQGRILVRDGHV
eukprot:3205192-Prymnesium_polylepis.1